MFYIGCPMWGYKEWVGEFFPPRTPQSEFLRLYSRRLTTVEGNTTFYATPNAEMVARWRMETPSTFRFCFKIPRAISHEPRLDTAKTQLMAFLERMRALQERLGPMFLLAALCLLISVTINTIAGVSCVALLWCLRFLVSALTFSDNRAIAHRGRSPRRIRRNPAL